MKKKEENKEEAKKKGERSSSDMNVGKTRRLGVKKMGCSPVQTQK